MASSVTGGGLVFAYNSFLMRGANLLDLSDPPTARQNLGIIPGNLGLQSLTFGSGLNAGSYNAVSGQTISVNSSTNGTASTIASYDSSGNFTTGGSSLTIGNGTTPSTTTININGGTSSALATLTRNSGVNGNLTLQNTGTGILTIQSPYGPVQVQSIGSTATISTSGGTTINASQPGGASSTALTVTGPTSGTGLVVSGGASIDSLTGTCISDSLTGTSSTIAASTKALAVVATTAATVSTKLDTVSTTPQTIASTVTFNGGLTIPVGQVLSCPRCYQSSDNGATTVPSVYTSGGTNYNIIPATSLNSDNTNDFGTGLATTGVFTAPVTGIYHYSATYAGTTSTTLTILKFNGTSNSSRNRSGPGTALTASGWIKMTQGHTLFASVGTVTTGLTASSNYLFVTYMPQL